MSKNVTPARPRAGGSYTRDAKSGKLTRDYHTRAASAAPATKQAEPADPEAKEA